MGEITALLCSGSVELDLARYEIVPTGICRFDVRIKNPIKPMD